MTDTRDPETDAGLSPLPPNEAERAAWNALSRDEQIARYRDALARPDCDRITDSTMAEVLAEARKRAAGAWRGS